MLDKLLRAPLPEQIVALLEKLEQNPDTSHLDKVLSLMNYNQTRLTRYEEWVIRRQMRKIHNVIRRAQTLDDVMSIVVDRPTRDEERAEQRTNYVKSGLGVSTGTISGTLHQHALAQQAQIAHINAHQQLMNQAQYASGYVDARDYWNGSLK
jgi:hypothetical protein